MYPFGIREYSCLPTYGWCRVSTSEPKVEGESRERGLTYLRSRRVGGRGCEPDFMLLCQGVFRSPPVPLSGLCVVSRTIRTTVHLDNLCNVTTVVIVVFDPRFLPYYGALSSVVYRGN